MRSGKQLNFSPQQKEGRLKIYMARTAVIARFLTQDMSVASVVLWNLG